MERRYVSFFAIALAIVVTSQVLQAWLYPTPPEPPAAAATPALLLLPPPVLLLLLPSWLK